MLTSLCCRRASGPRSSHIHDEKRQPTLTIDVGALERMLHRVAGDDAAVADEVRAVGRHDAEGHLRRHDRRVEARRRARAREPAAPAATTPPPATMSGRLAVRSSCTAACTAAAAGRGGSVAR